MATPGSSSGSLKKMTITSFKKEDFSDEVGEFTVMVNPSSISHTHSVSFKTSEDVPNKSKPASKYVSTAPEKLSFEIIFDATGIFNNGSDSDSKDEDLIAKIDEFKKFTYTYDGDTHEPPFSLIQWGKLKFEGRLESMEITHSLFNSGGNPIRSKVKVSFISSTTAPQAAKEENKQSPDLSHIRVTREGDTLPLMCEDIYGDCSYYLEVAKVNNMVNFRKLKPGIEIMFPPLR